MYRIELYIDGGLPSVQAMKEAVAYDLEKYGEVVISDVDLLEDTKKVREDFYGYKVEKRVMTMRHRLRLRGGGFGQEDKGKKKKWQNMFGQIDLFVK